MPSDILIIGAGPIGLFAGFYAGMRNLSTQIVDSLLEVGGQPKALYPEKKIYDIPAYPHITGNELIEQLSSQLTTFHDDIDFHLGEEIISIEKTGDYFTVKSKEHSYEARAIIIACGNGSFSPRRVDLMNLATYENRDLRYHIPRYSDYLGKRVVICGGGDSAIDHAITLSNYAKEVIVVHRRPQFRAMEYAVKEAEAKTNVHFLTPYVPERVDGDGQHLESVTLKKARSGELVKVPCDAMIIAYGYTADISAMQNWGLAMERNHILVDQYMATNIPGIFAIGDAVTYPGKTQLIVSGFGEAPTAINSAYQYLNPDQRLTPLHSTDLKA